MVSFTNAILSLTFSVNIEIGGSVEHVAVGHEAGSRCSHFAGIPSMPFHQNRVRRLGDFAAGKQD